MPDQPWLRKYDPGVPQHLEYPAVPVFELLAQSARRYPHQVCTIYQGKKMTFRELDQLTNRLAASLVSLGVAKGEPVGLLIGNTPQFVIAFMGVLKAGGIVVAINMLYKSREIVNQVNDAQVQLIFAISEHYPAIKELQAGTSIRKIIVVGPVKGIPLRSKPNLSAGDAWLDDLLEQGRKLESPHVDIQPEDTAIYQYTGGTTGTPKGALGTHRNLVANVVQFRHWLVDIKDGHETVLVAIPLFHVYGMVLGMLLAIYSGASMVLIPNPRDFQAILKSIQDYKVTIFPGVPTLYNAINNHPEVLKGRHNLSSIKACISGSAPLLTETKQRFEALTGGKLMEGYGLSEAPTATHCNPMLGENRPGSIGLPLPDVEARIVSLEDGMTVLAPGSVGELVLTGPQVMKGYHNLPVETRQTLREGWLYTGDIAKMDEDGYFYIVDRKKDLIKPGGYSVWPREVEEIIKQHPKVDEVCVAGVPDTYRGETVKAWVVLKPGITASEEEIRQHCQSLMAAFKVPTEVEFRSELPKTLVGKVLRRELVSQHKQKKDQ